MRSSLKVTRAETSAVVILFLGLASVLAAENYEHLNPMVRSFGFEYGHIASAIIQGQGFANPFGPPTGATAWMPPAMVWITAGVFGVLGIRTASAAWFLLALKAAGLALSAALMLLAARRYEVARGWLLLPLLTVALVGNYDWLTGELFDQWLLIPWSVLLLYGLAGPPQSRGLYVIAFLTPWVSPALALGLLCAALVKWRRRSLGVVMAILLAAALWGGRNYVSVGAFYPVKSNLGWEFYQSNYLDRDGVLSGRTLLRCHPGNPRSPASEEYRRLGEKEFCAHYSAQSRLLIQSEPGSYLSRLWARMLNSLIYLQNPKDVYLGQPGFERNDARLLIRANLLRVIQGRPVWVVDEIGPEEVRRRLDLLPLEDPAAVWLSYNEAQAAVSARRRGLNHLWSLAFALIPTLALVVGFTRGGRRCPAFLDAAVLYLGFLLPYVLVSHYARYQLAALGLQVWLVWQALLMVRAPRVNAGGHES